MSEEKTIKLVQLPIPEVGDLYNQGNIPLAAGYLKTHALAEGAIEEQRVQIIPRDTANYGGDTAILEWLLQGNPDLVGFTCYMWNLERSLELAHRIKDIRPGIQVVLGGPEIAEDHPALEEPVIDGFVIGEGEQVFAGLAADLKAGKPVQGIYRQPALLELEGLANPYLEQVLTPSPGESIFLETMRGCPYDCKYCLYAKTYPGMRFFPEGQLEGIFTLARDLGVPEIYLMDPSFNIAPQLKDRLRALAHLNTTSIPLHTEIRLESVDEEIALLMKEAGFHSVEAGLQTVNEASLAAVGRHWHRDKFIRGARLLQEQGIDIKTGIILGLPHDGPEEIMRTLDFVSSLELEDSMEIYPLALLPGTALRQEARELGLKYMPHPPYWVLSNRCLGEKDMTALVETIENRLEIEFFPPVIPRFENPHPPLVHFLDLRTGMEAKIRELVKNPGRLGHSLTFLLGGEYITPGLADLGEWLKAASPFSLIQVVWDRPSIPSPPQRAEINRTFAGPPRYFDRIHHYKIDTQGRYSLRLFHLTADLKTAEKYLTEPMACDLVLRYTPKLLTQGRSLLAEFPILLVDQAVSPGEEKQLRDIYRDFPSFLLSAR